MSAGNCPRCGGVGRHPSRHGRGWSVICGTCKGTGMFPPPAHGSVLSWWYRFTDRIDGILQRLGVVP